MWHSMSEGLAHVSRRAPGFARRLHKPQCVSPARHVALGTVSTALAVAPTSSNDAPLVIPQHWDEQISKAPLGRRRVLQRYMRQVAAINALEPAMRALSDAELASQTLRFRSQLECSRPRMSEALDQLLPEAFATVREASRRVLGLRHFDSQLVGGMVLHEGQIAEMATGEGKTLVAVLAAYLNALPATISSPPVFGQHRTAGATAGGGSSSSSYSSRQQRAGGVHVVTVNDYLAARDAAWMGKVFRFLGLTVGAVQSNCSGEAAQAAYSCHVTYVTGQELCFNYLKDNTATSAAELMLPDVLEFAVVDEVDSILIDESRNPMIISQTRGDTGSLVVTVDKAVRRLWRLITDAVEAAVARQPEQPRAGVEAAVKARYLVLDAKQRSLSLSQEGMSLLFSLLAQEPGVVFRAAARRGDPPGMMDLWEDDVPWGSMAVTALKAYQFFQRGVQYIVRDGCVVIVDESTGRVRPISRYSGGLHQAIEAKEGVDVKPDSHATASITFQVFFRFYRKLAGMTGTAAAAAAEFFEIYGLRVVPIPTNKPPRRHDLPLRLYYAEQDKLSYVVSLVESCWAQGRPVLIGTSSVNESEVVLRVLQEWCRPAFKRLASRVQLLNAKPENVRLEAQIVAQAGLPAAVTIATNMAGRGTDIILGGNPEGLARMGLLRLVYRWLLPGTEAAGADGQAAKAASSLDALCPAMPLDVFQHYDRPRLSDIVRPRGTAGADEGLPRPLHLALLAAMMFAGIAAEAEAGRPANKWLSHDDVRQLAAAALSAADTARRTTLRRLQEKFGHARLQDLDFTSIVASEADTVFDELSASLAPAYLGSSPQPAWVPGPAEEGMQAAPTSGAACAGEELQELQKFSAKAALLLWLWFDQECEGMAEQVVAAGGLLVLGTSLQEGARIELQLRGRAGRQGDPGSTQLLFDLNDPLFAAHGMQSFQQLAGSWLSSGQLLPYQESVVVDMLHKEVQRSMENQWQMARLETKKYDEVLEVYRRNLYSLRRLILTGTSQQRRRVVHMFIQQWLDQLVARLLDPHTGPVAWTAESLEPAVVCASQPQLASSSRNMWRSAAVVAAGGGQQQPQQSISPLGALMWHIQQLVNPGGTVRSVGGGFKSPAGGAATGATARVLTQLGQHAALRDSLPLDDQQLQHTPLPVEFGEVQVLTQQQLQQLASYLVQGERLPWPRPPPQLGVNVHLALAAHAELFRAPSAARHDEGARRRSGSRSNADASSSSTDVLRLVDGWSQLAGAASVQRPLVTGRHAHKVCVLRDYLGTALLHAFELRQQSLQGLLVGSTRGGGSSSEPGLLDLDAELYLDAYCRSVMLEWVDALWSCFLEEIDKMRHAVGLKAYSSQQPVEEFRLEANRAFLLLMDSYREAIVTQLMVPDVRSLTIV